MNIAIYVIVFLIGVILMTATQLIASHFCREELTYKNVLTCDECGEKIDIKEFIPLIGYFLTKAKCNKCNKKNSSVSILCQVLAGICYVLIFSVAGFSLELLIYCILTLVLIVITYVDFKTYIIPPELNYCILALGIFVVVTDFDNWMNHLIGLFAMSIPTYLLIIATNGRAMGGGDCKLLATAGLLIGWKLIILAFFLGCIFGSVIHTIRIKVSNESHRLALGPYLALGVFISMIYGNDMINWYFSLM